MKINSVHINNFGILQDIQIDFDERNNSLVFLNASNGGGKTTFQSALAWCFYNQLPNQKEGKFVSNLTLKNASIGQTFKVLVEVELTMDTQGSRAKIQRSQTIQKVEDNDFKSIGGPQLLVMTTGSESGALTHVVPDGEIWLRSYFPQRFQRFFLFDGEKMAKFWELNVKLDIQKAIKEIARVDLFESISLKMSEIETNLNRKISRKGGDKTKRLVDELEQKKKLAQIVRDDFASNKDELDEKEQSKKELSAFMAEIAGHEGDAERLNELELIIEKEKKDLVEAESEYNENLLGGGVLAFLTEAYPELVHQVNKARDEDWLPPPFEPERIKILLDQRECICGNSLEEGSEGSIKLVNLIEKYQISSSAGKILDQTFKQIQNTYEKLRIQWILLEEKNKRIGLISKSLSDLNLEKDALLTRLRGQDAKVVAQIASEFKAVDVRIVELRIDKDNLEKQMLSLSDSIDRLEKQLEDATKDDKESMKMRQQVEAAKRIAEAANQIYIQALNQVRQRLQDSVSEKFALVKEGNFKTVITDEFEVLTLDNGREVALSEGENMLKAYIFSIALREVINLGFPLVVDTPFGRLGGKYRKQVSDTLADLVKRDLKKQNRQIIFLMHDLEYTPYTREYFASASPIEMFLANDPEETTSRSNLGIGINPEWFEFDAWKDWNNRNNESNKTRK